MKYVRITFALCTFFFYAFATEGLQIEYASNVIDTRPTSIATSRASKDIASFEGLQVGDIFIGVDNLPRKITAITQVGDEIEIQTAKPDIDEAFNEMYLPQTEIFFDEDAIIKETMHPGLTITPSSIRSVKGSYAHEFTLDLTGKATGKDTSSIFHQDHEGPASGKAEIRGEIRLDYGLGVESGWSIRKMEAYAKIFGYLNQSLDITLEANLQYYKHERITLYTMGADLKGAGKAYFDICLEYDIEGKMVLLIVLNESFTNEFEMGYKINYDLTWKGIKNRSKRLGDGFESEFDISLSPSFQANMNAHIGPSVVAEVELLGYNLAYAHVWAGLYAEFDGVVKPETPIGYNSKRGISYPNWKINADLQLGAFVEPTFQIFKDEKMFGKNLERTLYNKEFKKAFYRKSYKR